MRSSDSLEDEKPISAPKVVLMMSKITKDKLTSPNYSDWSKTICFYLRSIRMASHLDKDPPTDDSKDRWLEDDARLFLQIRNFSPLLITVSTLRNKWNIWNLCIRAKGIFLAYSIYVEPFIALRNKIGPSQMLRFSKLNGKR